MAEDVVHSTQYYIKYTCINKAILANLLRRPLKLRRLIVLRETHLRLKKLCSHGNSLFSMQSPTTWLQYGSDFQVVKRSTRLQARANMIICLLGHAYEVPLANIKMEWELKVVRKAFNIGEVWKPQCCHGTKTVILILQSREAELIRNRDFPPRVI